jgi:hypothetical protein
LKLLPKTSPDLPATLLTVSPGKAYAPDTHAPVPASPILTSLHFFIEVLQRPVESGLTAPIRLDNTSGDITPPGGGIIDSVNGDSSFHPVGDGIPNNAPGEHVFHRAEVKLSFPCLDSSHRRNTPIEE